MKNLIPFIFVISLFGCSPSTSVEISTSDLTGAYVGKYPCNGCGFSRYVLVLNNNATFILKSLAVADGNSKEVNGKWKFENNEVALSSEEKLPATNFVLKGSHYLNAKNIVLGRFGKANETLVAQALNGADVVGVGQAKNWSFEIMVGKKVVLKHPALDGNLELKYHKPVADYELKTYTWKWAVNGTDIELVITDTECGIGMPAAAVIKVNGAIKEGCVQFINPNFLLQKVWQLKKFRGEELIPQRFDRGPAVLEIDAFSLLGMGHTGCNVWNGGVKLNGNKIIIMPGAMSNRQCGWADFEKDFVKTIGQEFEFIYTGNKLDLLVKGEVIFEFEEL